MRDHEKLIFSVSGETTLLKKSRLLFTFLSCAIYILSRGKQLTWKLSGYKSRHIEETMPFMRHARTSWLQMTENLLKLMPFFKSVGT